MKKLRVYAYTLKMEISILYTSQHTQIIKILVRFIKRDFKEKGCHTLCYSLLCFWKIVAGTITALTIQEKNKERVNVFVDGSFALGISLNAALNLKKGQFLDDKEIARLKSDDQAEQAFRKSLHFLSFRMRTQQETVRYLQKKDFNAEAIQTLNKITVPPGLAAKLPDNILSDPEPCEIFQPCPLD